MSDANATAAYKIVADAGGNRYRFYCGVSGALLCTTGPYRAGRPAEEELLLAWELEGRPNFNHCKKCGKWVADAVYNPEVLECVQCAPYEAEAKFCKHCGKKLKERGRFCPCCGKTLLYEGEW